MWYFFIDYYHHGIYVIKHLSPSIFINGFSNYFYNRNIDISMFKMNEKFIVLLLCFTFKQLVLLVCIFLCRLVQSVVNEEKRTMDGHRFAFGLSVLYR
jgi:hypothetical protein